MLHGRITLATRHCAVWYLLHLPRYPYTTLTNHNGGCDAMQRLLFSYIERNIRL